MVYIKETQGCGFKILTRRSAIHGTVRQHNIASNTEDKIIVANTKATRISVRFSAD
jgi:hypothetical protein